MHVHYLKLFAPVWNTSRQDFPIADAVLESTLRQCLRDDLYTVSRQICIKEKKVAGACFCSYYGKCEHCFKRVCAYTSVLRDIDAQHSKN